MSYNQLTPQATVVFDARLDEIVGRLTKAALEIKQSFNARGMPHSSQAVLEIYQRIDAAIIEMGKAASEAARLSYEAGRHSFSEGLEPELLNVFELNFSTGLQRLLVVRARETQPIIGNLQNLKMLENNEHLQVARRAQVHGQLELRQYFQTLKRARKRWYDYIPLVAKLAIWLFKGR